MEAPTVIFISKNEDVSLQTMSKLNRPKFNSLLLFTDKLFG